MIEYTKFDADERFGLAASGSSAALDGSIGRGGADRTFRFETAEGREYFVLYDKARRMTEQQAADLDWLKAVSGRSSAVATTGRSGR